VQILTDRILKEAGLDFAVARALLRPAEGELTVHVVQVLDASPARLHDSSTCLDNHLHEADSEHGGQDVRLTAEGELALGQSLPTIEPTNDSAPRGARSCAGRAAETSAAAAAGAVDVDCRGWTFTQAVEAAKHRRLTLTYDGQSVYTLETAAFGLAHFMSLSSAIGAIRSFSRMIDAVALPAELTRRLTP
jgi:hypothetical protein